MAVAEALSFRRAAEQLRVSQPALSKQVKDLELHLGTRLLQRNTTGVSLTDAGGVFLDEARDILERVEMASAAARDAGTGLSGRLVMAGLGTLTANLLPAALSEFRALYPKVDVTIRDLPMQEQLGALKSGALQLGFFLHGGGVALPASLESMPVLEAEVAIAMCYQHRLAKDEEISLTDLMEEQILCAEGPGRVDLHRQRILAILAHRGIPHRPLRQVGSFDTLVTLVAGNHGVSLMIPSRTAKSTERIVFKRIREQGEDLQVRMSVIWRKGGGSALARNFVEVLKALRAAQGLAMPQSS